jgi:hypothetical protein
MSGKRLLTLRTGVGGEAKRLTREHEGSISKKVPRLEAKEQRTATRTVPLRSQISIN